MQERVTYKNYSKHNNLRKFLGLILLLIFIVVVIIGIIISVSIKSKKYYFMNGQSFYIYYTETESTLQRAKNVASTQQSSGGAGYIIDGSTYYICAFMYVNSVSANEVVEKNKTNFPNGGFIIKSTLQLSSKAKKIVKNEEKYITSIYLFEDAFNAFYDLAIECDSKNLSEVEVFNQVFVYFEKFMELSSKFEDINSPFSLNIDAMALSIKDFLSNSKTAIERSSGLKYLCFEIISYYNNIAGWLNYQ